MADLYYIENIGCDNETCGLAWIEEEDFPKFKAIIENLNKNSYCGCMPTIIVYKADIEKFKDVTDTISDDFFDNNYVYSSHRFYLDGKIYTWKEKDGSWTHKFEQVIGD